MAPIAVVAQEAKEKQAPSAARSKQPSQDKDQAGAADDQPDAPADEKPLKKTPKKGIGLKVTTDDEPKVLKTLSYMQGFSMGQQLFQQFTQQGVELDQELFFAALKDGMAGKEPTMTEEEMKDAMTAIQKYVSEKYAAKAKEQAAKNKEEGTAFLAENKRKEGVKALPSGLQYKVIKSGKGETPKPTDTVKMHYKGTFINNKEFDSSYKNGVPVTLPLANFVKGMSEALLMMKVGDKWQLFVPSNLAYGEQGSRVIPPNATLLFEVELLGIEKGSKTPLTSPTLKSK
jgi:FKBP-type peptidyl-prolyl cis-trans isomerase FklB